VFSECSVCYRIYGSTWSIIMHFSTQKHPARLRPCMLTMVWARHTDAARTSLFAVYGMYRFQAGCARLLMPAWPGAAVSFRLHPARRRLQQPPSSVVITLAACDPTYTAVHCRQCVFPVAGSRLWNSLPPDITSAPTLTVSRNRLKTYLFVLTNCFLFLVLYTVYSGLAVLYLGHSKEL